MSESIPESQEQQTFSPSEKPTHPSVGGGEGSGNRVVRSVANVVSGNFLSEDATLKNFPFIFFLSLLAIVYIAYGYYSDDQVRRANSLTSEIKELRTQYIVAKDSLVIKSKQTEVAKALEVTGIKEKCCSSSKNID